MLRVVLLGALAGLAACAKLDEVYSWKQMTYVWPNEEAKESAIKSGEYIPYNNLPCSISKWKDKLFVTVPRWREGVVSTLNYIPLDSKDKSPAMIPYPDLKANALPKDGEKPADNHLVSTFRVYVDACDRLWAMDTGVAEPHAKQHSKPALVVFDLKTDKLLRRYELKPTDLKEDTFLVNVIVEAQPDKCDESFAYIPDLGGFGLIVYSWKNNDSWRVKHHFFHFDPLFGDFNVGGINFQWTDGVFGLALSKVQENGYRTLYFHPMASSHEFSVSTEVLQNQTVATDPHSYHLFKDEGDKGPLTQTAASEMDQQTGVLFLTQISKDGVACWNTNKPLNPENCPLIAQDKDALLYPNEVRVDEDRNLWVFSNKLPVFVYKHLNPDEQNFRVLKVKVDDAIAGTACEK